MPPYGLVIACLLIFLASFFDKVSPHNRFLDCLWEDFASSSFHIFRVASLYLPVILYLTHFSILHQSLSTSFSLYLITPNSSSPLTFSPWLHCLSHYDNVHLLLVPLCAWYGITIPRYLPTPIFIGRRPNEDITITVKLQIIRVIIAIIIIIETNIQKESKIATYAKAHYNSPLGRKKRR